MCKKSAHFPDKKRFSFTIVFSNTFQKKNDCWRAKKKLIGFLKKWQNDF